MITFSSHRCLPSYSLFLVIGGVVLDSISIPSFFKRRLENFIEFCSLENTLQIAKERNIQSANIGYLPITLYGMTAATLANDIVSKGN